MKRGAITGGWCGTGNPTGVEVNAGDRECILPGGSRVREGCGGDIQQNEVSTHTKFFSTTLSLKLGLEGHLSEDQALSLV